MTFRLPVLLVSLSVLGILSGLTTAGCGSNGNEVPEETVREGTPITIPRLSPEQKVEGLKIALGSPVVVDLVRGRNPRVVASGVWTTKDQQLLGMTLEIKLGEPADFSMRDWPTLGAQDEQTANDVLESSDGSEGLRSEESRMAAEGVTRLNILVDLMGKRVVEVLPQGPSLRLRYPDR